MMKNRRPIVTAAAVLAISAVAGSTLAEGASTPTPAALARQLAARVADARTNAARYQAVLDVMKALHVPVFTADGKQLSSGSRGLARDFNLYDFQLRTVADSFRVLTSMDDFASVLSSGGKRVDPALVRRTLLRGVQA